MIDDDKISALADRVLETLRRERRMTMDDLYRAMFGAIKAQQVGELRTDLVVATAALRRMDLIGMTVYDNGDTSVWLAPDKSDPASVAAFLRG